MKAKQKEMRLVLNKQTISVLDEEQLLAPKGGSATASGQGPTITRDPPMCISETISTG